MKTTLGISIVTLMFAISCNNSGTIIDPSTGQRSGSGDMFLKFESAPPGITSVLAKLSRSGYSDRTLSLSLSDTGASGGFDEVPVGRWHLRIDARDSAQVVRYSGETDVDVLPGQTSNVSLQLMPTTGRIVIAVTWGAATPDPTVALWHIDETAGSIVGDVSGYGHNASASGTTIVQGRFGNARSFNGSGDYLNVPNPSDGMFDFGVHQSFTIGVWCRTSSSNLQEIIRKGCAPLPGYLIEMVNGKIRVLVGENASGPTLTSNRQYNDGEWHHAALVRDRGQGKLFLYVDDSLAVQPITDNYSTALANTEPLTIGRWVNSTFPTYFTGSIDEIRISRAALHPIH